MSNENKDKDLNDQNADTNKENGHPFVKTFSTSLKNFIREKKTTVENVLSNVLKSEKSKEIKQKFGQYKEKILSRIQSKNDKNDQNKPNSG